MDKHLRKSLFENAKKWIYEAGEIILDQMNKPYRVESKSNPNDLVTPLDQQTEKFFIERIKTYYPDHSILSEEGYGDDLSSLKGITWIIDPIDGTMNFVHQKRNFAISLGIYCDGVGEIGLIYDVVGDVLYHGLRGEGAYKNHKQLPSLRHDLSLHEAIFALNHYWLCTNHSVPKENLQSFVKYIRGTRTVGSAALELAYVAEGILDGFISMRLAPWDIAAGYVLIKEVGGKLSDHNGKEIQMIEMKSVVCCNEEVHGELIYFLKNGKL